METEGRSTLSFSRSFGVAPRENAETVVSENFCQKTSNNSITKTYYSEPFNYRFFKHFREGIASWGKHPIKNTRSYSEGSLKQKIEIMGELNASVYYWRYEMKEYEYDVALSFSDGSTNICPEKCQNNWQTSGHTVKLGVNNDCYR